ncbi:Calx-beta domain-containing protein [Anabaena azotica]|uniref:Calx-beta domain-containing protein n=1 Tax=Anabaena azotica FACHB-119 TaxID=947527 RepID=A0ABR8CY46_9NOST|nr:Calx-beta domain-containing protein [Anabaena azotica]MBD2499854.1 hypothetical protein [Anabaena azotica FACHB-119]
MSGILQFSKPIYTITESGKWVGDAVTVIRTDGSEGEVSVKVTGKTESATVGKDVEKISQVLTWADGDTEPKLVDIKPVLDKYEEGEEFLSLTLGSIKKAKYASVKTCQLVIIDEKQYAVTDVLKIYPPSQQPPINPINGYRWTQLNNQGNPIENWHFRDEWNYWLSDPYFFSNQLRDINADKIIPFVSFIDIVDGGNPQEIFVDTLSYNLRIYDGTAPAGTKWVAKVLKNGTTFVNFLDTTSNVILNNANQNVEFTNFSFQYSTGELNAWKLEKGETLDLQFNRIGEIPKIDFTYSLKYRKVMRASNPSIYGM